MYKIIYTDNETNTAYQEYGFSKYMMKRICFIKNHYDNVEIDFIFPLIFTAKTFWKCLTRYSEQKNWINI